MISSNKSQPLGTIGVFDSGLGGLTVLAALRKKYPHESMVYLGDTARLPYGTKSPETVIKYALNCAKALMQKADLKHAGAATAAVKCGKTRRRFLAISRASGRVSNAKARVVFLKSVATHAGEPAE